MQDILTVATLVSAGAVTLAVQLLKLKIVPVQFANKYPVPTNLVLSAVATVVTFMSTGQSIVWSNWLSVATTFATIAVAAAIAYNQLLANWSELKQMEG